ncbi:SLATT domain-containing protein [Streptomyces sp. G45]|uniref:SLATT domain-containing protein n=1 Tax=Streptomyces sp. G45 TaxID=3406627 RepID=UPI003C2078C9
MQPEGVPHDGPEAGADGPGTGAAGRPEGAGAVPGRPGRGGPGTPGDLGGRTFPLGDWGEPAARLDELYRWVERGALDTAGWYLRDRGRKRLGARLLRGGAALGAVGTGVLPLLDLAGAAPGAAAWGFVSLLAGVACVGCDRFFGFTSGWMRDVATAQAVQRRLQVLQFDWASESVREVLGPTEGTASEAAERCLLVLRRFSEDVTELVRAETADWMVEFRAGSGPLAMQVAGPRVARGEAGGGGGRFPLPPGARPNMPRQRPPDAR